MTRELELFIGWRSVCQPLTERIELTVPGAGESASRLNSQLSTQSSRNEYP
jgi:hypothetical protein